MLISYLSVDSLVSVGGLYGEDHSGSRVLFQHERVGKGLENGSVVVDVLLTREYNKSFVLLFFINKVV